MVSDSVNSSCLRKVWQHSGDRVDTNRQVLVIKYFVCRIQDIKLFGAKLRLCEQQGVVLLWVWKVPDVLLQNLSRIEVCVHVQERD